MKQLTAAEQQELLEKVREIHDFVKTLQLIGMEAAQSNSPMAIMMRNMIPGIGV